MNASRLIALVGELVRELHPNRAGTVAVSLESRLEQDLGIDSLGRTELILRTEREFGLRLPVRAVSEADTVGDLLRILDQAPRSAAEFPGARTVIPPLPLVQAASEAHTLIEVLDWHVARHPDRLHLTLLEDDRTILGSLTYAELRAAAGQVAAGLAASDIAPGDRIALMLPTSLDFFVSFFGILYAGAVPVPIYPPMRLAQLEEHIQRQIGILRNAGARMLITMPEGMRFASVLRGQVETLQSIESRASLISGGNHAVPRVSRSAHDTALIQYTSGSTGDPKGVVLSHANLLSNVRAMGQAINATAADVFVSWLPLYHDMGLIGAWFGCLHFGAQLYIMSPLSFLVRPENWLRTIHRFRGTLSASPNFGFELCVNKIDDSRLDGLDLSSLRMVANGAEPVSLFTLRRFCEKFSRFGFREDAMAPVYGLAENAVGLAFPPRARAPIIDRIDRTALSMHGVAQPATADDPHPIELVSSGQTLPGHEIRIVDEAGREVGERKEGRLEFRGPSATSGYFNNDAKTRELLHNGWLDSGDRAYAASGEIFITGRIKDIIIRAGRHLYPQEVEEAVAAIPGIRKGGVVVFGAADPKCGTERVIVVAETLETDAQARAALAGHAQALTSEIAGTPADEIVLVPPRSAPKTSSGKIRRGAAKALYESGKLGAPPRAVWLQVARLALKGFVGRLRRSGARAGGIVYAAWWWSAAALGYAIVWLGVMTLPGLGTRWRFARLVANAMLQAVRIPVSTTGVERIPVGGAVLVFNHSSYADVILLAAALPGEPVYVAKKELATQIFAGPFLKRLGVKFVERFDIESGLGDVEALLAEAQRNRNLVFFPEGTFTRRTGLSGFYLGAFKIAAAAGLPVCPGILTGTRSLLRSGQWFPRWTPLSLTIEGPVRAESDDLASVVKLRDAARRIILARCNEPDLDELIKPAAPSLDS